MKRYLYALILPLLALLGGVCGPVAAHAQSLPTGTVEMTSEAGSATSTYYEGFTIPTWPNGTTLYFHSPDVSVSVACLSAFYDGQAYGGSLTDLGGSNYSFTYQQTGYADPFLMFDPPGGCSTGQYPDGTNIGGTFLLSDDYTLITGESLPTIPMISFYQPSSPAVADFMDWELSGSNLATDSRMYRSDIVYSQAGGSATYDDFNLENSTIAAGIVVIPKTQTLPDGTGWYAQGFLFETSSTDPLYGAMNESAAIASTTPIYFTINSSSTPSSTPPISSVCPTAPPIFELTDSLPYFTINNPIPSIESGGCNVLLSAFQMTSAEQADILSRYAYASAIVSTKPPLGYFSLITSALGSFQSGSTTITLLTPSSTAALSPIFSPLDTGLAAAVGLVGVFWLIRRLKHIQP